MLATLLLMAVTGVQEPLPAAEIRALERLADLPPEERSRLAEAIFDAVLASDHPLLHSAAALRAHPRVVKAARLRPEPARAFAVEEFAPALALKTKVFRSSDAAWKSVHRRLLGGRTPPPIPAQLDQWDPGRDAWIQAEDPPTPAAVVEALLHGQWPPDGRVRCWAEAALDDDTERNPTADYFGHTYRNRDGGIYSGIRLADVWECGREFEVSDVETVAWLRTVAHESDMVSPIPATLHRALYRRMELSFVGWREYWSLRQALAARMLEPGADIAPEWRGARSDLDAAWVLCAHDPEAMLLRLRATPMRSDFFAAMRAANSTEIEEPEAARRAAAAEARASVSAAIRTAALGALRDEGLLGLGGR